MKRKFFGIILFSVLVFVTIECTISTAPEAIPGVTDTLILGDTVTLGYKDKMVTPGSDFWISFDSLLTDSRCPIGVICFWAGNAEIQFKVGSHSGSKLIVLNTHPDWQRDTVLNYRHISLIDVAPYPHIDSVYVAEDYKVRIIVE